MNLIQPVVFTRQNTSIYYELDIYRGDLEHPNAPGNKWHKLQYHLREARRRNTKAIATFGGPFSNHLHAFSMTLQDLPFKAIGVVRGELQPQLTPTLRDAVDCGAELWPSLRTDYKKGLCSDVACQINRLYQDVYWIPEGGGGELGALGCRDWAESIIENLKGERDQYDAWVVSAGTGTTAAGLLAHEASPDLHVVSALKGAESQRDEIIALASSLQFLSERDHSEGKLQKKLFFHGDSHEGGYAKFSPRLTDFLNNFATNNPDVTLDPVYTSKSMLAILQKMEAGSWPYARTLFIHTGGLQGWRGYPSKNNPFKS